MAPSATAIAARLGGGVQLNQLVRMEPVLALVRELGPSGTLLDVGSGSRGLAPWLPAGWRVTAADSSFDDYGSASGPSGQAAEAVVADVRELPFEDAQFDAVVALDLLEHVPPADRPQALAELRRVTRRRLVVACPAGADALAADRRLANGLKRPPGWLDEHIANGFPERGEVVAALGPGTRVLPNENVAAHERIVRRELSIPWFVPTRAGARLAGAAIRRGGAPARIAAHGLRALRGRDREPAYRTIFVLDRELTA